MIIISKEENTCYTDLELHTIAFLLKCGVKLKSLSNDQQKRTELYTVEEE